VCSPSHLFIWMYVIQRSNKSVHVSFMSYIYVHVCLYVLWKSSKNEDESFYYHSWRNNVVIAFGTLSSFLSSCSKRSYYIISHRHSHSWESSLALLFSSLATYIDRKKPPPLGGFLFWVVSKSRIRRKRTPPEEPPQNIDPEEPPQNWSILGVVLQGGSFPPGSWSGNIINRKPPRGGGVLSINM